MGFRTLLTTSTSTDCNDGADISLPSDYSSLIGLSPYINILNFLTRKVRQPPTVNNSSTLERLQSTNSHNAVHPIIRTITRRLEGYMCEVFHRILGIVNLHGVWLLKLYPWPRSEETASLDVNKVSVICLDSISRVQLIIDLGLINITLSSIKTDKLTFWE